jgi:alkylation response protein AidB-like acyl-CoA dehydrogenase
MTDKLAEIIKDWCKKTFTDETIIELENDHELAVSIYRDFARRGWLEYANIFEDKENLHTLLEIGKIISGYSSVISNMVAVNCVCSMLLTTFGNDKQKETGRDVLGGEILTSFSLTERNAGSDIQNIQTTAVRTDDHWVLNGEKYLATGAAIADYILMVIRTNLNEPINNGISLFLVPRNASGLEVIPQQKIATNGFASCRVILDSIAVPMDAVIGDQDCGWGPMTLVGAVERLMVAASCVGLSRKMLEYLYEYTQKRIIQGHPLYDLQLINHQLADMVIKIKAADLLLKNATDLLSSGATPTVEICGAKVFASEMQQEISLAAMKIIGGRGYLKDYPIERWMREGLLSLYAGGTNELQKNLIARKLSRTLFSEAA